MIVTNPVEANAIIRCAINVRTTKVPTTGRFRFPGQPPEMSEEGIKAPSMLINLLLNHRIITINDLHFRRCPAKRNIFNHWLLHSTRRPHSAYLP